MRVTLSLIAGGLAIVVGTVLWARHARDEEYEHGDAELADATMVDTMLVVLAAQTFTDASDGEQVQKWRATVHDATTGARLKRVVEVEWRRCADDGHQRMWCLREQGGVERVKVPSLEIEPTDEIERALGERAVVERPASDPGAATFPGSERFPGARLLEATPSRAVLAVGPELRIFERTGETLAQNPLAVHAAPFGGGQRWLIDQQRLVVLLPGTHSSIAIDLETGRELWRIRH